jgi:23S rRNA pseudouridine2604 synthase
LRINKLLSNLGICSRREANRYIEAKRVKVNGVLSIPGQWVEETDEILIDDIEVKQKEKIYIAFNKPVGITCTAQKTVKDNIIDYINYPEYIFPVGRLDKFSQGLILLTNDGEFANKILNSENKHEKEYIVKLDKPYQDDFIPNMSNGVDIGNGQITRTCKVYRVSEDTFKIILTQGLNRQIRRMSKKFGFNVIALERIRILNLKIQGIDYGNWRRVSEKEINEMIDLIQ